MKGELEDCAWTIEVWTSASLVFFKSRSMHVINGQEVIEGDDGVE